MKKIYCNNCVWKPSLWSCKTCLKKLCDKCAIEICPVTLENIKAPPPLRSEDRSVTVPLRENCSAPQCHLVSIFCAKCANLFIADSTARWNACVRIQRAWNRYTLRRDGWQLL